MDQRYIPNDMPLQEIPAAYEELLKSTLHKILENHPVPKSYREEMQKGIFSGYTSLVFLLLRISLLQPDLQIQGHDLRDWAKKYLEPVRGDLVLKEGYGGLHSEKLSVDAIKACLSGTEKDVQIFLDNMPAFLGPYAKGDPYLAEPFYGRTGVLYLLRMVKHFAPQHAALIDSYIGLIAEEVMESYKRGGWDFVDRTYLGACHGAIGIITQLVLSYPSVAPRLSDPLQKLLDLQQRDGNWPKTEGDEEDASIVQFCHGAPGFVICLKSLRPYYPDLQERIDNAILRGQELIWNRGLLTKEPSLCHGIFGNALALPRGPRRNHFLALATPEAVHRAREGNPDLFKSACYTAEISPYLNYLPGAAWAWAVAEMEDPPVIAFNDV